jgi:ADP-heptose:LPS heptosyltransferase
MSAARVLVIKLGALGDFIQAMGPFAAIRAHHAGAHITLLTTKPFEAMALACPWFDAVEIDSRPGLLQPIRLWDLRRRLRAGRFERVYDLQTSDRSSSYFRLMGGRVEWSGIARGCALPHANPDRDRMHTIDRQRDQLAMAGITDVPAPDLGWLGGDVAGFALPDQFALLCAGGAAHRPAKRWPAERFAQLSRWLQAQAITPVLLGTHKEGAEIDAILAACPGAVGLAGRTDFGQIAELARRARLAVGNDTGPMHLIAAVGCPSLVLFSHDSDPALCAPRGRVTLLRRPDLGGLETAQVEEAAQALLGA